MTEMMRVRHYFKISSYVLSLDLCSNVAEKKLYCIYVAIGQKRSTVAQIVKRLSDAGEH